MRKKDLSKHMSGIYFLEKTSYEDSKQRHLKISFVLPGTVCMYIFVVTTVGMFMDAVQFSWNLKTVLIWAALGCMLPGIFCLHKKGFWVGMTLLTAISIGFWLNSDGQIWAGVLDVYERIGDLIHVYYSGASRNFNLSGNVSDNFLIAFVLLLCIYEGVFILGLKRSLGGAIPGIAVGTGCLLMGQVPQLLWLYLFIFTLLVFLSANYTNTHFGSVSMQELWMRHFYIRGKQSVLDRISLSGAISLIVILLLGICAAAAVVRFVPLPDKTRLSGWQSDIRALYTTHLNFFEDGGIFEEQDSGWSGKISGGDLNNASGLSYDGSPQLKLVTDHIPENILYIKGYVGDFYDSGQWKNRTDDNYAQLVKDLDALGYDPWFPLEFTADVLADTRFRSMEIEKLALFGDYYFSPYGARMPKDVRVDDDLYVRSSEKVYTLEYSTRFYEYYPMENRGFSEKSSGFQEANRLYAQYVTRRYTRLPDGKLSLLLELCEGKRIENTAQAVDYVRRILFNTCTYSLTPGAVPEGKDPAEYFLFENRQGYCMHFATVGTLLLRGLGIPARYVEGYTAIPSDFEPDGRGGAKAIIYDHQAHAWSEVFVDGFGWIPVDFTPGYYDGEVSQNLSDVPDSDALTGESTNQETNQESLSAETDSTSPITRDEQTQSGNGESNNDADSKETSEKNPVMALVFAAGRFLLWPLLMILAAAAAAVAVILRRSIIFGRKQSAMRQPDNKKALLAGYDNVMALLAFAGFELGNYENSEAFVQAVTAELTCIQPQQLRSLLGAAHKAAFGPAMPVPSRNQEVLEIYDALRHHILKSLTWAKRLYFKYVKCF